MNDAEMEDIFDPFKQVEAGKAAGGTGLGLAITRRLAERLEGGVTVVSEEGKGSTFTIDLPLEEAEGESFETLNKEEALRFGEVKLAPGQEVMVLVVDDRDTNRDILDKMLTEAGFGVRMADDGDTGLESLREEKPDIVLLDVRMPRMNGIETVKEIRKDLALEDLTVIAVTASVFPEFKEKALEEGFDDFLGKPFRTEELMEKLKEHLGVEYVSAEVESAEAEEGGGDLGEVPPEMLEKLKAALKIKNLAAINGIVKELKENPEAAGFGEAASKCARGFDFAGLEKLIKDAAPEG